MNYYKLTYWISTSLLCLLFFAGGLMYLFNYPRASGFFENLGFPVWLIYPLAALKISGAIVVISRRFSFLKELAYAGFLYDAILALVAHVMVLDGEYMPAIIALALLAVSWWADRKAFGLPAQTRSTQVSKRDRLIYWVFTGFISLMFTLGGLMYLVNYEMAHQFFVSLGFPTWIIYPLAALKFLGVVALLSRRSFFLKELDYAGFLYDAILAVSAHLMVLDGQYYHGLAVIIATCLSWVYDRKIHGKVQRVEKGATKASAQEPILSA